jgi:excisionase family DNA binding protein
MFKTFVPLQKNKAMEQQQQVTEKQFYTTRQLGEYLDITERTILDLIRAKELKARKVFNKYIIEHSAIAEYINKQKSNF